MKRYLYEVKYSGVRTYDQCRAAGSYRNRRQVKA